jgi:Ca-activated chloride channel family protein
LIRLLVLVLLFQATLSVRTVLVVVPVTVTDARGHRVIGLTQDNFRVYEDGRPQPVTVFHHGEGPITLGLVVDHSYSMRDNLGGVTAAVAAFSSAARLDDEMFVVGFNERVSRPLAAGGEPFTNDARALAAAVRAIPALGQTALYDALIEGLDQLKQGRWDKRTLIVVSDGGDNASVSRYADVQALALQSQAVIYAIGLRGASAEQAPKILRRLCKDTGGVAYFPHSTDDVPDVLKQIVRDLREQYTLGFVPEHSSPAGAFRTLEVTASAADGGKLRVRTRAGYVVPDDPR